MTTSNLPAVEYTTFERRLVIEYVVTNSGDIEAARIEATEDNDWPDGKPMPTYQQVVSWSGRDREASRLVTIYKTIGLRDKLAAVVDRNLTRADQLSKLPLREVEQNVEKRMLDLMTGVEKGVNALNNLMYPDTRKTSMFGLQPRNGYVQNMPENADAEGDQTADLVVGNQTINLFNRREILVLARDLQGMSNQDMARTIYEAEKTQVTSEPNPQPKRRVISS